MLKKTSACPPRWKTQARLTPERIQKRKTANSIPSKAAWEKRKEERGGIVASLKTLAADP